MSTNSVEEPIFDAARHLADPAERRAYLDRACRDNLGLRARIELLLSAHGEGEFLELPASKLAATAEWPAIHEEPGSTIGPYKLLEQIGEGGMGLVFMAEQSHPIRRRVALKVIKPGLDTKAVIARFEAERQALALMEHPHIAHVFDAGTTKTGRPYFVMELVRGVPITDYCRDRSLDLPARLELFIEVCQAVQHAHQKGIIHRDLKPTNILVGHDDTTPVPKVIDFGVAKAMTQPLTEGTMFTHFAQLIGTPLYMSPEQAEFNYQDVDTRSDVYSLGVVLYELLTGTTPFDKERLRSVGPDEMRRIIREEEPPRPSTRSTTMAAALTTVASPSSQQPMLKASALKGELDWIVMKALEKDRGRRYESASTLAADLRRHLNDQPVEAAAPSAAYRFHKFFRRYRTAILAGVLVVVSLMGGIVATTWQALRATRAERTAIASAASAREAAESEAAQRKRAEAVSEFIVTAFRSPNPLKDGRNVTVAEVLQRSAEEIEKKFADDPVTRARLLQAIGSSYVGLGLYSQGISLLEKAFELRQEALGPEHDDTLASMELLAQGYSLGGRVDEGIPLVEKVLALRRAGNHPLFNSLTETAHVYKKAGRLDKALPLYEEAAALAKAKFRPDHVTTLAATSNLANAYREGGKLEAALPLLKEALNLMKDETGLQLHNKLTTMTSLAITYANLGQEEEALPLVEEVSKRTEIRLGPDHPDTIKFKNNVSLSRDRLADIFSNVPPLQDWNPPRALERAQKVVQAHPESSWALTLLGWAEYRSGHWQRSIEALQRSLELQDRGSAFQWYFLAMAYAQLGETTQARQWYDRALAWMGEHEPENVPLYRFRDEAGELLGLPVPSALSRRVRELLVAEQWDEAAVLVDEALDQFPESAHPYWRQQFHIECGPVLWDEVYERLKELRPTDRGVRLAQCHCLASLGRWSEVAELLERIIELDPSDYIFLYDAAPVYLHLHDEANYRRICKELLTRFGETQDLVIAESIATTCFLAPSAESELEAPLRLAKMAAREENLQSPYAYLAKALGEYRNGNYESAIADAITTRHTHGPDLYLDPNSLAVQAMAEYQLGRMPEAKKTLAALQHMEQQMPKRDDGYMHHDWAKWLRFQILRSEAESLVGTTAE